MNANIGPSKEALVTVALPVLNGGLLLEKSVQSVLNQTWTSWELLILDDGSSDGAVERLSCLGDPRIVVVRDGYNRGLAARLNEAISRARGKYFARMDHDDISHFERFMKQVEFLERNSEVDLLGTQCVTINEGDRIVGALPGANNHTGICKRPWQGFYMAHPSWMGRTSWFRKHYYQDPASYCCEDQELLLRAHRSSCYHVLPEFLLAYRVRSHTSWKKLWRTRTAMVKMQVDYFFTRKQWGGALLSVFVGALRIARDGWRECCYRSGVFQKTRSPITQEKDLRAWQEYISALSVGR